jgi:hypothetical protein
MDSLQSSSPQSKILEFFPHLRLNTCATKHRAFHLFEFFVESNHRIPTLQSPLQRRKKSLQRLFIRYDPTVTKVLVKTPSNALEQ